MYTNSKYPLLFYDPWCRKVTFSVTSCFLGSNEIIEYASYRNSIIYRLAYFWIMRILWNKGGGAYGCRLALITQMLKISEKETSKLFNVCGTKRIILEESNLPKLFRRKEKKWKSSWWVGVGWQYKLGICLYRVYLDFELVSFLKYT